MFFFSSKEGRSNESLSVTFQDMVKIVTYFCIIFMTLHHYFTCLTNVSKGTLRVEKKTQIFCCKDTESGRYNDSLFVTFEIFDLFEYNFYGIIPLAFI